MNKGNNNGDNSVKKSRIITRFLIGGAILGALYYSYRDAKKAKNNSKSDESNTKINDKSDETEDNEKEELKDEVEIIDKLINLIYEDPVFGPEDIYINKGIDKDFDENNPSYVKVDLLGGNKEYDQYVGVTLKLEDTLYSRNRVKDFFDRDVTLKDLRNTIFDVKSRKDEYKGLKYKVEPLGFYFYSDEGFPGELMDVKDLRDLKSISGFRYIRIRFLDLSDIGIRFIEDVLRELHPNGGEEEGKFNISPFVIDCKGCDVTQMKNNRVSNDYLDNGERYK
jgi:hypothetical protein